MTRSLALLSAAALLAAAAQAQCPQGTTAGLVKWSSTAGYTSTFAVDDEGLTNPPVALPFSFPMPGVTANLDQMWINSNGEIYLSDSTAGLLQPAGGASFGVDLIAEMRGPALGSPRIVPMGDDQQSSVVAGATWSVTVDTTSVAGQATVTWVDMRRFGNATDRFSFSATLFATGAVQFNYGTGIAGDARFVGISIGNNEGVGPSQDLTTLPTSPVTESILYESFTAGTWDLSGQSVLITPDFTPGVETYTVASVTPYVAPTCASNTNYGTGCFSFTGPDTTNLFQLFADVPATKAALDGNALQFTLTPTGYTANWLAGAAAGLYVAPTIAATIVANGDDTTTTWAPSVAVPVPGGTAANWTVSSNGVLTAALTGNQGTGFSPTLAATATATGLAWYTWTDHNPAETGSGKVKREEVGNMLYVTFDGVEHRGGTPTLAPSTFQWQINMTTGDVTMVWTNYSASNATNDVLVGCTLVGAGPTPVSQPLSAVSSLALTPIVTLSPMTLSASPRPVINPSTLVTWTANNIVEAQPSSGLYLSTMFLSVNPIPGGFDLTGILSNVAGCNAYIATLDLDLGAQVTFAPTASWSFTFDNIAFAPGNVIAAQAVALFDPTFPLANGANGGYQFSNGVRSETHPQ